MTVKRAQVRRSREKLQHALQTAGTRHCSAADRRSGLQTPGTHTSSIFILIFWRHGRHTTSIAANINMIGGNKSFGPSYFSVAKKFIFPYLIFIWIGFNIWDCCIVIWNIFIWFWDNLRFTAVVRCLKMALIVTPSMNQFLKPRGGKYQHRINNTNWQINDHWEPNIGQNYTRTAGRHGRRYINKTSHTGQPRDTWHCVMTQVINMSADTAPAASLQCCNERLGDTEDSGMLDCGCLCHHSSFSNPQVTDRCY